MNEELSKSIILWRYLDMAKFMDLLQNSSLFFTRADKLEDKFEGSFTESVRRQIEKCYKKNRIDAYEEFKRGLKRGVFINCWHQGTRDNMAMWRIYGNSSNAIAITTTVGRLGRQLEPHNANNNISIRKVKYINHFDDPSIYVAKYTDIYTYKHEAYEFEKEARSIVDHFPNSAVMGIETPGYNLTVELANLLRSVVVSPESPEWFYKLVKDVCGNYGCENLVKRSELAKDPI
jgi:hypothetical protein